MCMSRSFPAPAAFAQVRQKLVQQYADIVYTPGWGKDDLRSAFEKHCAENPAEARIITKAWLFKLICEKAPIAPEENDYFVGKVQHYNLLLELRNSWRLAAAKAEFAEQLGVTDGSFRAQLDCNSHICPDWASLLELGVKGIRDRALTGTGDYHKAAAIAFEGFMILLKRFDEVHPGCNLAELAERPPRTLQEALQLSYIYNEIIEFDGLQVRSMGRFDKLFNVFYERDLASGILTRESAAELLRYYLIKFFAKTQGLVYGKPFTFGPGNTPLTMLTFEVYNELNIVDPKFHLRVSENTPDELLQLVCQLIRDGRSAIVLVNNDMQEKMLVENGKTPEDAADYILIGCYEPAVMGVELNCSGAGLFNLAKPVEQALLQAEKDWQFEDFLNKYYQILMGNLEKCLAELKRWERLWPMSNPSPLFSAPMLDCHKKNKDISDAGAKYNTTGVCCVGLADAVDSIVAVKMLREQKLITSWSELQNILQNNWQGFEDLRKIVMHKFPAWGNNIAEVDKIAIQIAEQTAGRINCEPNTRNGRFQAALYAILPAAQMLGERTGALPNGRLAGTILTMNTNCENGRDINGVTALLHSVASLPLDKFPNGTTLDVTLHPSSVAGNKGVNNLKQLIQSYFQLGGNTVQFNIFNRETLLDARKNPEKYTNLQVRVCGWNVRFIDLAPEEQQIFIDRAGGDESC